MLQESEGLIETITLRQAKALLHALPPGTWVVAAGNRAQDRALVRALSSALVNRVIILNIRVDVKEWLAWGHANGVRGEILAFITFQPEALMRPVPAQPIPFSTP